jgi:predicted transcriptional regulator
MKKDIRSWDEIDREITLHALKLRKEGYKKYHTEDVKPKIEDKEREVYRVIRVYAINGERLNHDKLAYLVDLDRKRLRRYTTSLTEKGLVKRESGPHGRYYLTKETHINPLLKAYLFGDNFRRNLLEKDDLITTNKKVQYSIPPLGSKDFTTYRRYFEPKFSEKDKLERTLFEFSNRIGAFISYVLIQAMSRSGNNEDIEDPKVQNVLVQRWVNTAITKILPHLAPQFKDSIDKSLGQYYAEKPIPIRIWKCLECNSIVEDPNGETNLVKMHQNKTGHTRGRWTDEPKQIYLPKKAYQFGTTNRFLFDKKTDYRIRRSFEAIYPLINYEFEKIFQKLPNEIESYKKFQDRMFHKWKQQEICDHEYAKPTMTLQGYYRKQCSKCQHFKKVRKPLSEI